MIENRKIRSFNPDFLAPFAKPTEAARLLSARRQIKPELTVLRAGCMTRIDKHAVMSPLDLIKPVSHGLQGSCHWLWR